MALSIEDVIAAPPSLLRMGLAPWVSGRIANAPELQAKVLADLENQMAATSEEEIAALQARFAEAGKDYQFYAADPVVRRVSRSFLGALTEEHSVEGWEHLEQFLHNGPSRRMIVCNHLSYTDTQVTDAVLSAHSRSAAADRLVAVAGPKVYSDTWRRLATIGLNTRKTPQSTSVASEMALAPREVARLALEAIQDCSRLMDEGYIILLYPEGTRSRTGRIGPFLRAAARYTAIPGLQILPLAQTGSEKIFPIDDPQMYKAPVRLAFGAPFEATGGRTESLERARARVVDLLPEDYRPSEDTPVLS